MWEGVKFQKKRGSLMSKVKKKIKKILELSSTSSPSMKHMTPSPPFKQISLNPKPSPWMFPKIHKCDILRILSKFFAIRRCQYT